MPPPLAAGDAVLVVAPSSPFRPDLLWTGLAWLQARYRVRMSPGVLARKGFLAGPDARRADELAAAVSDPEVRAVIAARGGHGAVRIIDSLSWDQLAAHPKWLVGFSDVTALHAMAWRAGVASIHGPNVTGLGRGTTPAVRAAWLASLERPRAQRRWSGLRVLHPGKASGPIVGGNLTVLHAMAAAGRLALPPGAVLALEDVTEAPYRIDRMLASLRLGGHLGGVAGLVFGGFDRCEPGPDGTTVDEVIDEHARLLGVPALAGAPFGHAPHNEAFVLGAPVSMSGDELRFEAF